MANTWNESGTTWNTGRWGTTEAITSGWGADAWNTGGSWGQATDELVSLTGVSATTSIGDVISSANQGWGRAGWSEEPYGESNNPVVTLTSLSATTSLGDSESFNETGWGRLTWGTAEIESAFVAHPKVAEAAVVGYPHDIKGNGLYCYVTLNAGENETGDLERDLKLWVRKQIGPLATPDLIHFTPGLPKTRSGKIMRRILRKIAANEHNQLGDTTTLADPSVVDSLVENRKNT